VIAGLGVALGILAAPCPAATISGAFDGNSTLTPTGKPGVFIQNFTGDGNDVIFGAFTASSQSTIDFSSPPHISVTNAMLLETFADGTLFGTGSGSGTASGQGTATFAFDFLITGGTGRFAGDKGAAIITGTITQTGPTTEAITASFSGSIAAPEPSTMALWTTGLAVFGLRRRRP
jgi:hypothetical protein